MSTLSLCNDKHSGEHPVTMRRLMSPLQAPQPCKSPMVSTAPAAVVPATPPPPATPADPSVATSTPVSAEDLAVQNERLKSEIERLQEQLKAVMDHTIESDRRLLQYTDEIFVVNAASQPEHVSSAVQCQPPHSPATTDTAVQCDMQTVCADEQCRHNRQLIRQLRTTIEVLEADNRCMKLQLAECGCDGGRNTWTVVKNKKLLAPVPTQNRFGVLACPKQIVSRPNNHSDSTQQDYKSKYLKLRNKNARVKSSLYSKSTQFSTVVIKGDSHVRHIAGLVQGMVDSSTAVSGVCKPGARMLDIVSLDSTPSAAGAHCEVFIAGTNDLDVGSQRNIYQHLEERITAGPASTRLVIATLPHRHDVLDHRDPIHVETVRVNAFIEDLASRHNVTVLDFNKIRRRHFTTHGQHLSRRGKKLLAHMVVESLSAMDDASATEIKSPPPMTANSRHSSQRAVESTRNDAPAVPTTTACNPPPLPATSQDSSRGTEQPLTLPYETYADAAEGRTASTLTTAQANKHSFLEIPLSSKADQ